MLLIGTDDGLIELRADGHRERLVTGSVTALATGVDAAWAVVDDTRLWRGDRGDRGGWQQVAEAELALRCLLDVGGSLLAGAAQAQLLSLGEGGLAPVSGFAGAPGRDAWYTPWGGPPDTRSLAVGPRGILYANVHVGGVPRSRDGGETWEATIDVDADVHQVVVHDSSGLVVCASARGLAYSVDAGDTWAWRTDGLHATYLRALAVAGDDVLVSASEGPGGERSALYRAALNDVGALRRCGDGLPEWFGGNVDTFCLAANDEVVVAADGGAVYRSDDRGVSWGLLAAGLPAVRCLQLDA